MIAVLSLILYFFLLYWILRLLFKEIEKEKKKIIEEISSDIANKINQNVLSKQKDLLRECQNCFGVRSKAKRGYYDDLIKRIDEFLK